LTGTYKHCKEYSGSVDVKGFPRRTGLGGVVQGFWCQAYNISVVIDYWLIEM
jgi:hypothetical protein